MNRQGGRASRQYPRRLLDHAQRETGQSRRVADFLLAWWNAGECGGFDLSTLWGCDPEIVDDMVTVFGWVAHHSVYPDKLGYDKQFQTVVAVWRPEVLAARG
jgi:hypothetical protein